MSFGTVEGIECVKDWLLESKADKYACISVHQPFVIYIVKLVATELATGRQIFAPHPDGGRFAVSQAEELSLFEFFHCLSTRKYLVDFFQVEFIVNGVSVGSIYDNLSHICQMGASNLFVVITP